MLDIGSKLRKHWLNIAWVAFCVICVTVVARVAQWETIPFHLVWLSLALIYGIHPWRLRTTVFVLAVVTLVSGVALYVAAGNAGGPGFDEMTEVPLMAAMFIALIWYAERAKGALATRDRALERERDFIRNASHELRTPITIALGHAELVRRAAVDIQQIEDTDVVLGELSRLARAAERLLLLTASEHPDFLRLRDVSVFELLEEIAPGWKAIAPRRWTFSSSAPGTVPVDVDRLRIAVDSLIENAVRSTLEGDAVDVAMRGEGSFLVIEVSDTGCGISFEELPDVFDRFVRAEGDRRTQTSGGTGLGLPIVRAIAQAHGGSASVTSTPGQGSTFCIRLPGFRPGPDAHAPLTPLVSGTAPEVLST